MNDNDNFEQRVLEMLDRHAFQMARNSEMIEATTARNIALLDAAKKIREEIKGMNATLDKIESKNS